MAGDFMTLESKYLRETEYYSNNNKVPKLTKEGFIYILTNPSFPNYVKIDEHVSSNEDTLCQFYNNLMKLI